MSFIQYCGTFTDYSIEPISLSYYIEGIDTIEIYTKEKKYIYIKFNLKNDLNDDIDHAKKITAQPLGDVINLMLFLYGHVIKNLELERYNNQVFLYSNISVSSHGILGDGYGELQKSINNVELIDKLRNNINFRLYKSAMNVSDPFGRYMFLYSILYGILETQQEVESYIIKHSPSIEMCERTKDIKGNQITVNETIYTWIRNHMGHTNSSTDMRLVKGKVDQYLNSLECMVKELIS
jgi:hypothetical protein